MAKTRIGVRSLKNQAVIADKCFVAERFFERLRGLLGRRGMEPGEGLLIRECNNIHMWFMQFPIDVVFVKPTTRQDGSRALTVTSAHADVPAWKVLPLMDSKARETLELPVGTIRRCAIEAGDELCIN